MEATAGFGTEVHQPVDSSHDDKKNNNKNENITSNDKKNNPTFIDAEDNNQTMEAMTMVVTAMVNDENSQEQETITSCDHVKNCQSRNLKTNGNNDSMSDVALTEHLYCSSLWWLCGSVALKMVHEIDTYHTKID